MDSDVANRWAPYCFFVSENVFDGFDEAIKTKGFMSKFRDSFKNINTPLDAIKNKKLKLEIEQILLEYPKVFVDRDVERENGMSEVVLQDFKREGSIKLPFPKLTLFMSAYVNARRVAERGGYWDNGFYAHEETENVGTKFDAAFVVFLDQINDTDVRIYVFIAKGHEKLETGLFSCTMTMDGANQIHLISPPNFIPRSSVESLFTDVLHAIHTLTFKEGSVYMSKPTPKEVQVNRKKLAKGKVPLIEFRLIKIEPSKVQLPSLPKGTHASPRQHWRRGHWRNLASGKRVFVKPMLVGDEKNGKIIKDYIVGEPVHAH